MTTPIFALLRFCIKRDITNLYKGFLDEIFNLHREQVEALNKIQGLIPHEYHGLLDALHSLDANKIAYLRKKILDNGNGCIRNAHELLDKIEQTEGNVSSGAGNQ